MTLRLPSGIWTQTVIWPASREGSTTRVLPSATGRYSKLAPRSKVDRPTGFDAHQSVATRAALQGRCWDAWFTW